MRHLYRVTVEALSDVNAADGQNAVLTFETDNHDDIFAVLKKLEGREDLPREDLPAFGVGLKLFSEVMLKNKQLPLFADFLPHFVDFMKRLKGKTA